MKKQWDELSWKAEEVGRSDRVMTRVVTKQGKPVLQVRKRKGDKWRDYTPNDERK